MIGGVPVLVEPEFRQGESHLQVKQYLVGFRDRMTILEKIKAMTVVNRYRKEVDKKRLDFLSKHQHLRESWLSIHPEY